jgi:hypothetical protein
MEKVTDTLETMILLSLDANQASDVTGTYRKNPITGDQEVAVDMCELAVQENMNIESAFTCDMNDGSRIYATTPSGLLHHPLEILGAESEVMLFSIDSLAWRGFRMVRKAPRGISYLGKPACFYEIHNRIVRVDGTGIYWKKLVALNSKGEHLPTFLQGVPTSSKSDVIDICIGASVIEDAHRANAMLAEVKDVKELKFPVPIDDYKNVFANREGPMNGSRRKSIVHWVAKHLRHSTENKLHEVKRHTRGIQEFVIDGLRVRLTPNAQVQAAGEGFISPVAPGTES